ncbi:MAG: T9SS type A sorting domain-containing protein [Bacteroidia bacterium]
MKRLLIFLFGTLIFFHLDAQLYINSDLCIQNNATIYADDTIQLGSSSVVINNGILQSTKSISTNGYLINTGTTGFIISPVASGVSKTFDIGTSGNNKIQLQHATGSMVIFQLAVRDSVFLNPQTNISPITSNVVNKTWYLSNLSSVSSISGSFYWNAADESSGFLRSNCGMSIWQNGSSTAWSFTNGTSASSINGSSPNYSQSASTASLGPGIYYFGVGGFGSALPITIVSFDANKISNDDVMLAWITKSEINNDHFELERSVNSQWSVANGFETIATIKGAGNSNTEIKYSYPDTNPFAKQNTSKLFYRLKQMDVDGKYQYTEMKEVALQRTNSVSMNISVYPNPNSNLLNIDLLSSGQRTLTFSLYDACGKQLVSEKYQTEPGRKNYQINTSQIPPGVYLLHITGDLETLHKQKLIVY